MLWKKTAWFWKIGFIIISIIMVSIMFMLSTTALVYGDSSPEKLAASRELFMDEANMSSDEVYTELSTKEQLEKGYNLPVDDSVRKEAEEQCKMVMEYISAIYEQADKGEASNVTLPDETVFEMQNKVKELGYPVAAAVAYSDMKNQEGVESFLEKCEEGKSGSIVIYEVYRDGGIGRMEYSFDGTDMYVVSARGIWNGENKPGLAYLSRTRIKEWKYTDKGWFCYQMCVPEPPEVAEIIDGSYMLRIKPMKDALREMSEKCVKGLGYQGQNFLCSNWDAGHMEELDYNGMYEYLYEMKYQEKFPSEDYPNGIPKEEFESLIMEYLPITAEQIREYAVFDENNQTYAWSRLGCLNYAPNFFGTSLPEVIDMKENDDGTITLTVDAVCEMVICDDSVITHELTVRFAEDGSFQYLGNKILDDGIINIPKYQYRVRSGSACAERMSLARLATIAKWSCKHVRLAFCRGNLNRNIRKKIGQWFCVTISPISFLFPDIQIR